MGDFKESRRVPKKLLPHFPLSEEEPQRVPLQTPEEMRPGNFKAATKTLNASSPGRPAAAAAPARLQGCRVDASVQSSLVLRMLLCKAGGAESSPSLSLSCPGDIPTVWEQERHGAGNCGTCSAAAGSRVPHRPPRSALTPQLRHQAGEPPPHHHPTTIPPSPHPCGSLGQAQDLTRDIQPWLQEGFLPSCPLPP